MESFLLRKFFPGTTHIIHSLISASNDGFFLSLLSESFASIDIPLVAVWLSTLSDDEVERFHTLKKAFSEEQKAKDELVDAADYDLFVDARNLEKERSQRDKDWAELFDRHVLMQKEERYQQFANTLLGTLISPSK